MLPTLPREPGQHARPVCAARLQHGGGAADCLLPAHDQRSSNRAVSAATLDCTDEPPRKRARLIERGVFRARRGSPKDDKHDHRAGAHGHARGAAGERAPQPSRPWRHDRDDPRSGHQLQQRPGAAQPGDDQSSQPPVDRRAELASHHASVRRAKLHAPELQSLAHMSGVKSSDAPRPRAYQPRRLCTWTRRWLAGGSEPTQDRLGRAARGRRLTVVVVAWLAR